MWLLHITISHQYPVTTYDVSSRCYDAFDEPQKTKKEMEGQYSNLS